MSKGVIFNKKNVLVIGGAGFIGSHLCDELVHSAKVICIDNFVSGQERNIDHLLAEADFEFVRHDISETIDLEQLSELDKFKIEFQGIQEIYYLACPMSVKNFEANRQTILRANSVGLANALDISVKYKAKFLLFSSSVVYGHRNPREGLVSENDFRPVDHLSQRGAYDEGKRFAETMVRTYRDIYGIDARIARFFRIYGPRMLMDDGQLIPDFISCALDNRDLEIFGDQDFCSSFCYISDAIDAIMRIMESDLSGPVNIGSDVEVKIPDLAQMIIDKIRSRSKIVYRPEKLFLKPLHIPDISLARNELGWMPVVTLEKGIESAIYELRAHKGLKSVQNAL